MKNHYLFISVIVLIMLLSAFLGTRLMAQQQKTVKIIKISEGDSIITQILGDSLNTFHFENINIDTAAFADNYKQIKMLMGDTAVINQMKIEFDTLLDPINMQQFQWAMNQFDENTLKLLNDIDLESETQNIKIFRHANDTNFIFIKTNGEDLEIERNGEMVFINKDKNVKNVDSQMEVAVNEKGQKVITVKTTIVLSNDANAAEPLGSDAIKSGNEIDYEYIKLYPNPSGNTINLTFKLNKTETTQVRISNALGKSVYKEKLKNFDGTYQKTIDLKQYGSGTYIVEIIQDKKTITRKVVIE